VNNDFLVHNKDPLAEIYSDGGVLENYHLARAQRVLSYEDKNVFRLFTQEQQKEAHQVLSDAILATDMKKHGEYVKEFGQVLDSYDPNASLIDARVSNLLLILMIKCADLSNAAKPFKESMQWNYRVQEEFFTQGDRQKKMGIKTDKLFDRELLNPLSSSKGFLTFVAAPLFKSLAQFLPKSVECLNNLNNNSDRLTEIINKEKSKDLPEGNQRALSEKLNTIEITSEPSFRDQVEMKTGVRIGFSTVKEGVNPIILPHIQPHYKNKTQLPEIRHKGRSKDLSDPSKQPHVPQLPPLPNTIGQNGIHNKNE
jgi:hypothetical protein